MSKTTPTTGGGVESIPSVESGGAQQPFYAMGGGAQSAFIPLLGDRMARSIVVPPGGFAGFAQQTAATQALFQRAGRVGGKRSAAKRRKKAKSAPKRRATRAKVAKRTRGSKRKARLVKGSAAAKRYMASIRRKRK